MPYYDFSNDPINIPEAALVYPTNMTECMANIDAGFGTVQAKQGACQAFLTNNFPDALDALAMGAQAANQVIYAGWCRAKANALRGSACTPKTCAQLGASCGQIEDGCGGMLDCGDCDEGECRNNICVEKEIDPNDEPLFPSDMNECLANIDSHMPMDQRQEACKELFNPDNNSETMLAFSADAKKAGYPIAEMWFAQAAEIDLGTKDKFKKHYAKYKNYYIVGGVAVALTTVVAIGISLGKD